MMISSTSFVSDIPELGLLSLNCDLPLGSSRAASLPYPSPGILSAPVDDGEDEEGWDEDEDWEDEDDDEEDDDYDEDEDDEDWEDEEDEDESDSDEED